MQTVNTQVIEIQKTTLPIHGEEAAIFSLFVFLKVKEQITLQLQLTTKDLYFIIIVQYMNENKIIVDY